MDERLFARLAARLAHGPVVLASVLLSTRSLGEGATAAAKVAFHDQRILLLCLLIGGFIDRNICEFPVEA